MLLGSHFDFSVSFIIIINNETNPLSLIIINKNQERYIIVATPVKSNLISRDLIGQVSK